MPSATPPLRPSTRCGPRQALGLELDDEIAGHDRLLDVLTAQASPTLRDGFGIGADTAAEMLIVFGDNPERIRPKPPSPSCAVPARSPPRRA